MKIEKVHESKFDDYRNTDGKQNEKLSSEKFQNFQSLRNYIN